MKHAIQRFRRSLPWGMSAESLAGALLDVLAGDNDPSTLTSIAKRLRDRPEDLPSIIRELLGQSHTAERHAPAMLSSMMRNQHGRHRPHVSLGTHCFTASMLRRWGLRSWSGPFDWLFSSVEMVTHCIEDDFRAFLDPSQYEPVPVHERPHGPTVNRVHHRLYRDRFALDYVFNHHDPHLPADHEHFQRAVSRFRACLSSDENPVFVVTRTQGEGPVDDLRALRDALQQRCRGFSLVVYEVPPIDPSTREAPQLDVLLKEGPLVVCQLLPVSPWHPVRFDHLLDEHMMIAHLLGPAIRQTEENE